MKKSVLIKNNINEIGRLKDISQEIVNDFELDNNLIFNLNLILEEVISNIIFYGLEKNSISDIEIHIEIKDKLLILEIIDEGIFFNPLIYISDSQNDYKEENKIGGLGILLIEKLSKSLEYQYYDNKNHLIIYL
ncbi:MAG: hypothetical protein AUJ98_06845 [Bacteroidetes bacterium CG2_30_33_31]|nr:MAG: hypothetical protein AUJ98_06845 [Bacteroidetes bacterium CG2_30_33_31]